MCSWKLAAVANVTLHITISNVGKIFNKTIIALTPWQKGKTIGSIHHIRLHMYIHTHIQTYIYSWCQILQTYCSLFGCWFAIVGATHTHTNTRYICGRNCIHWRHYWRWLLSLSVLRITTTTTVTKCHFLLATIATVALIAIVLTVSTCVCMCVCMYMCIYVVVCCRNTFSWYWSYKADCYLTYVNTYNTYVHIYECRLCIQMFVEPTHKGNRTVSSYIITCLLIFVCMCVCFCYLCFAADACNPSKLKCKYIFQRRKTVLKVFYFIFIFFVFFFLFFWLQTFNKKRTEIHKQIEIGKQRNSNSKNKMKTKNEKKKGNNNR